MPFPNRLARRSRRCEPLTVQGRTAPCRPATWAGAMPLCPNETKPQADRGRVFWAVAEQDVRASFSDLYTQLVEPLWRRLRRRLWLPLVARHGMDQSQI